MHMNMFKTLSTVFGKCAFEKFNLTSRCYWNRLLLERVSLSSYQSHQLQGSFSFATSSLQEWEAVKSREVDKLYKTIIIEVKGHDRAVLNSYEWFAKAAANELDIAIDKIWEPHKIHQRRTLLRSVHIYKKCRVQYERRTYFRILELKHLTGSTADTYLEYIQRNLPEGVAMKVTKHSIEKKPHHISRPKLETEEKISPCLIEKQMEDKC